MAEVVVILGSPRTRGNSTLLAESAVRGIEEASATSQSVRLHDMRIEPCRACDACQEPVGSGCVVRDDMQGLYPLLRESRALLIASPVYWFTVSAQTKLFLDRCYSLHIEGGHAFRGKRIGVILTYGDSDVLASGVGNVVRTFQDACRYVKADLVGVVHGSAGPEGAVAANAALMEAAHSLGRKLAQ